jgi:5-methylcytosine-specific restriction enzyme A
MAGTDWTDAEIQASVDAYFEMLAYEQASTQYNKSAINRALREGPLGDRSRGSLEFKFMNISAVLRDAGLPWIPGYKPAANTQGALATAVLRAAKGAGLARAEDQQATTDPETLRKRARTLKQRRMVTRPEGNRTPERRPAPPREEIARDPQVVAWVLRRSEGRCELCRDPAPFTDRHDEPFLEVHHVRELAKGGSDTTTNAVALCPNCHRELHHGKDAERLRARLFQAVPELRPE